MNRPKSVLLACLLLLVLGLGACRERISRAVISDVPVIVGKEWTHIQLTDSVVARWRHQVIRATTVTKFEDTVSPWGLKLSDGNIVNPEIEAVAVSGVKYNFKLEGFRNGATISFENDSIPQGTQFRGFEMRSSSPLEFSNIIWVSYMPEDTKSGNP